MWCFQCGAEYGDDETTCRECGVGLVDEEPLPVDAVGAEDEAQMAYDLHDWASESRRMLDGLLTSAGIDHAWQGASLIIREDDEEQVDEFVEEVERTTLPTLDPDKEHLGVDLSGWSEDLVGALSERMGLLGIAHEFDMEGDLVLHAEDEAAFDELVEQLSAELELAEDDADLVELDGVELQGLLTEVFVAADRLRKDPRDPEGVLGMVDHADRLAGVRSPFGIDGATWRDLRAEVGALDALLRTDEPSDDDDDEIRTRAGALRDRLHRLI
jgi:hypothetical protein